VPLGSGCRFRKGEQRHDEFYHDFIDCARAKPRGDLAGCGQLILLNDLSDLLVRGQRILVREAETGEDITSDILDQLH
jgi:hypothetical protein